MRNKKGESSYEYLVVDFVPYNLSFSQYIVPTESN